MWMRPLVKTFRSGFEITGYAFFKSNSTWTIPITKQNRSGFEITGYALNKQ